VARGIGTWRTKEDWLGILRSEGPLAKEASIGLVGFWRRAEGGRRLVVDGEFMTETKKSD